MIPPFDPQTNALPEGIHLAEWNEVVEQLGFSERRKQLLGGLLLGLQALKTASCERAYIDGSFATNKIFPGDFDVCYELGGMSGDLLDPVLKDFSNARAAQKAKLGGEFFPANARATPSGVRYLDFFQLNKQSGERKGIVAIDLRGLP